ncbi:hypothetical protein L6452_01793 [Arctium lappa]|uniref:Uncharacterized protein n=1 Tax=Arctium lappa TaxID=4217 RepID=A0ACB9FJ54_ARCLA|nr:hypothetical protein L6452_01793 [Arctium lappa]
MLQDFQSLEGIEVWNSHLIEVMVEEKTGGNIATLSAFLLPKLRHLSILPELKYITKRILICDSLETIEIWDCEKLRTLPFPIIYLPSSLKHIKGNRNWWDGLEWDETSCKNLLQPFFDHVDYVGFMNELGRSFGISIARPIMFHEQRLANELIKSVGSQFNSHQLVQKTEDDDDGCRNISSDDHAPHLHVYAHATVGHAHGTSLVSSLESELIGHRILTLISYKK